MLAKRIFAGLVLVSLVCASVQASQQVRDFHAMLRLAKMQARVDSSFDSNDLRQLRMVIMKLRGESPGASVYYSNGKTATSFAHKNGASLYYPNGQTATSFSGKTGASWYYPNGKTATSFYDQSGATWYYPNGQTITSFAGKVGASWYHLNGRTATSFAGKKGATWYLEDGSTLWSNGPAMSPEELLDVPRVVAEYLWLEELED